MAVRNVNISTGILSGDAIAPNPPWATVDHALSNSNDLDTISIATGIYPAATYYSITKGLIFEAVGEVVWTSGDANYVARTSSSLSDGDAVVIGAIVIDAEGDSISGFEIGEDSSHDYTVTFNGTEFKDGSARSLRDAYRRGTVVGNALKLTGQVGMTVTGNLGAVTPAIRTYTDTVLDISAASGIARAMEIKPAALPVAGSSLTIDGASGSVVGAVGSPTVVFTLKNLRDLVVRNINTDNLSVSFDDSASANGLIDISGEAGDGFNATLDDINIEFPIRSSHAVQVGASTAVNGTATADFTGLQRYKGIDAALLPDNGTQAPHGFTVGRDVLATANTDIFAEGAYATALFSCNLATSYYQKVTVKAGRGPLFYNKGCVNTTWREVVALAPADFEQIDRPIISFNFQDLSEGGTQDTTGCVIQAGKMYVEDPTNVHSFIGENAGSSGTISCVIYLPNDVAFDFETIPMFGNQAINPNEVLSEYQLVQPNVTIDNTSYSQATIRGIIANEGAVPVPTLPSPYMVESLVE